MQIEDDVQGFTYHTDLTSIAVYGGVDDGAAGTRAQVRRRHRRRHARPADGSHAQRRGRLLDKLDTLVLDEADRMMDMGFWPDVRRIVADAAADSAARQTLLFSATMPEEVMRLADEVVRDAEVRAGRIGRRPGAAAITHDDRERAGGARRPSGWRSSCAARDGPVLVFVRTKSGAERLARKLASFGLRAAALHADRTQQQRTAAVEGFRSGRYACSSRPTSPRAASTSTASRTS